MSDKKFYYEHFFSLGSCLLPLYLFFLYTTGQCVSAPVESDTKYFVCNGQLLLLTLAVSIAVALNLIYVIVDWRKSKAS